MSTLRDEHEEVGRGQLRRSLQRGELEDHPRPVAAGVVIKRPIRRVVDNELLAIEAADRVRRREEVVGGQRPGRELAEDDLSEVDTVVAAPKS